MYKPLVAGLAEVGRSAGMSAACVAAAQNVASAANQAGTGSYVASPMPVRAGWNNELRAGAVVREVSQSFVDAQNAVLVRVTAGLARRSP